MTTQAIHVHFPAFGVCAGDAGGGAVCAGLGRATQGAGAALAGVGGLTLVARSLSDAHGALAALLGAVALGTYSTPISSYLTFKLEYYEK